MKKIMVVFGTRPEAIKMVPVIKKLESYRGKIRTQVCITAQHRQMLDQVLDIFDIKPDYDLDIMGQSQTLSQVTTRVLNGLGEILEKEKPDFILVHGDTTTTLASALAGFYQRIPVGHVEAGLRSYDKYNPYPEEINRVLTDRVSELLFAPTAGAKRNLIGENIPRSNVFVTGNTVIDTLFLGLQKKHYFKNKLLTKLNPRSKIILITAHRRENWGKPLEAICWVLKKLVERYPETEIVYPVHLNPQVKNLVFSRIKNYSRIHLMAPLDYLDFINLMKISYLILTDSGGVQEEAPALGKPVLVLRKVTERPEAVRAGTVKIVGLAPGNILKSTCLLLDNRSEYRKMATAVNPYGDGLAGQRIVDILLWYLGMQKIRPSDYISCSGRACPTVKGGTIENHFVSGR